MLQTGVKLNVSYYMELTVLSVQNGSNGAPAPLLVIVYRMTITLPVSCSSPTEIDDTTRSGGGLRVTSMESCRFNANKKILLYISYLII